MTSPSQSLLETMRQFQPACILGAAANLDLFTALAATPATSSNLANRAHLDPRATTILLDALVALTWLHKKGEHYHVPSELIPYVTEGHPHSILPGIRHLANCLGHWQQLARVVKNGGPADARPSVRGQDSDLASFIGAMQNYTTPVIEELLSQITLPPFQQLLDIGGASGNWTAGFLQKSPEARATLFDRPEVIPLARQHLDAIGLGERVTLVPGNYHTDALPPDADLAWLSAIAHQNSREQNQALFKRIHAALVPGGTLLLRDIVLDETRTAPVAGALFAVNMLVSTEGGNSYTFAEYQADLQQACFTAITLKHPDSGMNALIQAKRPS